ncbi:MAG: polysaccharide biosynthesis C-terminal domain-containing protein [Bacteroidetes bacterium]|nr:polysaccharide biosynthesis C-terminal domain-containing protein [Bacteroidota bacterium]
MYNLFKNITLIVILNLLIKPIWIIMEFMIQDKIGHAQYGIYAALFSLGYVFIILSDFGINQYFTKTLAGKPDLLQLFPDAFTLKITLSIIYPFFMLLIGWLLNYRHSELYYLFLLCFTQSSLQLAMFFRANFQAFQQFRIDAFASVIDKVFLIAIIAFLFLYRIDLELYIYARLLTAVLAFVILFIILINIHPVKSLLLLMVYGRYKHKIKLSKLKAILGSSIPFALIILLYGVHERIDQVMLERLASDHVTGLYAAAYRWVDAFMMYLWTILPIFFARFAHLQSNIKEQQKHLSFGQIIVSIPMIFVCGFVFIYGEKLLWLLSNSDLEDLGIMTNCLKILFISVLVHGLLAIYGTLLSSTGHVKFLNKMMMVSIAINIGLNFLLIPKYGAEAAAFTTVISTAFLSVAYLLYIHTHLQIHIPFLTLLKLVMIAIVFTGTLYILSHTNIEWYVNTFIAGVVLLLAAYISGLLKISAFKAENRKPYTRKSEN